MSADLILVTGATGNTGSAVLHQLREHGARVRAMVRARSDTTRFSEPSVETVVADFDDAESIDAALIGVARAYLVTPSGPNAEAQQIRFAERAAAAGVHHVVKLSQFAADEASPVRFLRYHAAVERRIRELGLTFTFLRPNLYLQGLLAFQAMIANEGRFIAPVGDARVSAVDVRDIASVAAIALTQGGHEGRIYTITGPWWLADATSLAGSSPSQYFIDAIEDSELLLIDGPSHQQLVERIQGYATAFRNGLQRHAAAKDQRIVSALSTSAEERYLEFLRVYPTIALRVPQSMLASYLGMTPETVSRIRRRLSRK